MTLAYWRVVGVPFSRLRAKPWAPNAMRLAASRVIIATIRVPTRSAFRCTASPAGASTRRCLRSAVGEPRCPELLEVVHRVCHRYFQQFMVCRCRDQERLQRFQRRAFMSVCTHFFGLSIHLDQRRQLRSPECDQRVGDRLPRVTATLKSAGFEELERGVIRAANHQAPAPFIQIQNVYLELVHSKRDPNRPALATSHVAC